MTRSSILPRRLASHCLVASVAVGLSLVGASAGAAPVSGASATAGASAQKAKAKKIKAKRQKKARGITKWQASVPSRIERQRAGGAGVTVNEGPWALVSVRDPVARRDDDGSANGPYATTDASDRAAIAFVGAKVVDARSGWAQWKPVSGINLPPMPGSSSGEGPDLACILLGIGCGDSPETAVDVDLHLWVNAKAGHDYLAVCRVKFDNAVGELAIVPEGGSEMTVQIDHTGKNSDIVSFVVDTDGAGWHGVAISSDQGWWTTGCSVDEL